MLWFRQERIGNRRKSESCSGTAESRAYDQPQEGQETDEYHETLQNYVQGPI